MRLIRVGAIALALATSPAHALFGVGDLSFDPTTYGEVAALYKQTVELYKTAQGQLDAIREVEKTIKEAQVAYDSVVNSDINKLVDDLKPRKLSDSDDKISALREELSRIDTSAARGANYYQYQMQKLSNLERLSVLQEVGNTNMQRASGTKINTATTAQVTAQSTSTLAALAAAEEQRKQRQEFSESAAREKERAAFNDSKRIYSAIGGAK